MSTETRSEATNKMSTEMSLAHQFAKLMDNNEYDAAAELMHPGCIYFFRGDTIQGVNSIIKIYKDNYNNAQKTLDEIQFSSEVELVSSSSTNSIGSASAPSDTKTNIQFRLKYLDRIRKGPDWFEHRCEQLIEIKDAQVIRITHIDLPGETEKFKEWLANRS